MPWLGIEDIIFYADETHSITEHIELILLKRKNKELSLSLFFSKLI